MKKLNKSGWGLNTEIFFILLFVVCLIIAVVGINKFEIFNDIEVPFIGTPGSNKTKETNYSELESEFINGTKDYIQNVYNNDIESEILTLKLRNLINSGYVNKIKDNKNNNCSGYIEIKKTNNDSIIYFPYLKCKEYTTYGYDESKDE